MRKEKRYPKTFLEFHVIIILNISSHRIMKKSKSQSKKKILLTKTKLIYLRKLVRLENEKKLIIKKFPFLKKIKTTDFPYLYRRKYKHVWINTNYSTDLKTSSRRKN